MKKRNHTSELGTYKENITTALFQNEDIKELILGDTSGMSNKEIRDAFKEHVFSHLFIDDTITAAETFIFYDVHFTYMGTTTKRCEIVLYALANRSILDNYYKEGYRGNRTDILAQMIEDTLINDDVVAKQFGIGNLKLDSVDFYNSNRMYGRVMYFTVPDFR